MRLASLNVVVARRSPPRPGAPIELFVRQTLMRADAAYGAA